MSKLEAYKQTNEYKLWENIFSVMKEYDITGDDFITRKDIGGVYWEVLLDRMFKLGVIFKHTTKSMKGIKMDWIRPLLYLESQSNELIEFDGEKYKVNKGARGNCVQLRFALKNFFNSLESINDLKEENFTKIVKKLKEDSKYFFKNLNTYIKEGFRDMHENIKKILEPLRKLRKAGYRLFSLEQLEKKNVDLNLFKNKESLKNFVLNIKEGFKWDEFILKKTNDDATMFKKFLEKETKQEYYKYVFNNEKLPEIKMEDPFDSIAKKNLNISKEKNEADRQKKIEEREKLKELKNLRNLVFPNIENLNQKEPTKIFHETLIKEFEEGFYAMIVYLNKKFENQFPILFDTHKIFVNLNNIKKNTQTNYFLNQLENSLEELKILCYEMKLNGISRILIPITKNVEFNLKIKKVYDIHLIIENIMGDKLKEEQFNFFYEKIKFIYDSNLKDEFTFKTKNFLEEGISQFLIYESMRQSANVMNKMYEFCKKNGEKFDIKNFQNFKINLDTINELNSKFLYYFEYPNDNFLNSKDTENFKEFKLKLDNEFQRFGRFFLLENFISENDKNLYIECIEILRNINNLVQDDIRDFILSKHKINNELDKLNDPNFINNVNNNNNNIKNRSRASSKIGSRKSSRAQSRKNSMEDNKENKKFIKKNSNKKVMIKKKVSKKRSDSFRSQDTFDVKIQYGNVDKLRPPYVWNFPINRIRDKNYKENVNVVRVVDPSESYVDGRVKKFLELFDEIYKKIIEYVKNNMNDNLFYLLDKEYEIFGVKYLPFYDKFNKPVNLDLEEKKEENL